MENKKYYVLYKAIKNEQGEVIDGRNVWDFSSYEEIRKYLKCNNRDVKKMINNNINNLQSIKTFKNYFIIKEEV